MFSRFGIAVCVLAALSFSLVGCGRKVTTIRVGQLFKQKKYQEAVDILTPHLKRDPEDADSFFARGVALCMLQKYADALSDFDQVLVLNPGHAKAPGLRAKCLLDAEKYQDALEAYGPILERNLNATDLSNRAMCYYGLDQFDLAIADLETAIELDGNRAYAHFQLAKILSTCPVDEVRDGKRALEEAQIAVEMTRDEPRSHWATLCAQGCAYAECGEFEKAVEFGEQGLALATDEPDKTWAQEMLEQFRSGKPYRRKKRPADDPPANQTEPAEATQ